MAHKNETKGFLVKMDQMWSKNKPCFEGNVLLWKKGPKWTEKSQKGLILTKYTSKNRLQAKNVEYFKSYGFKFHLLFLLMLLMSMCKGRFTNEWYDEFAFDTSINFL